MRSITLCRLGLLSLVVVLGLLLMPAQSELRAAPSAGQSTTGPATAPTTMPATGPAADAGPTKPSKNRAWVSGTILGADGKPAVGVVVRAEKNEPMGMGGGPQKDTGPKDYKATTDENGNFVIKEMHINAYLLVVGNNEIGWIYQELPVAAGQETKLGTLKLTKVD